MFKIISAERTLEDAILLNIEIGWRRKRVKISREEAAEAAAILSRAAYVDRANDVTRYESR